MSRILVAMSGGVDSSVAAALLKSEGHDVVGATMKTFCYNENDGPSKTCCGLDGILDARNVANSLGITEFHVFDVEKEFTVDVIDNFANEYAAGRTPIPCVRCNSFTKFRDLIRRAHVLRCEYIATGHYLRKVTINNEEALLRGEYLPKDQSYFLWGVPKSAIAKMMFPVGNMTKPEVRSRATEDKLLTADKPESMEICFVPDGDYTKILRQRLGEDHPALATGTIRDTSGKIIGEHNGYARFTVGQRKGLPGGQSRKLHVLRTDPRTREVIVGEKHELATSSVEIAEINWLQNPLEKGDRVQVQIRHRSHPTNATITEIQESSLKLELDEPQSAVTPGQSGVLYTAIEPNENVFQRLAGGGIIQ
jgi:tRNA-uridine 2-sulfurtransferase